MNLLKRITASATALIMIAAFSSCVGGDNAEVATVNGKAIMADDIIPIISQMQYTVENEERMKDPNLTEIDWNTEVDGKTLADIVRTRALEEILKQVIVAQQAEKEGLKLTSEQAEMIEAQIGQYITQYGEAGFNDMLKAEGLTVDKLKAMYKDQLLAQSLKEKYDAEPGKYDGLTPKTATEGEVQVKHILIKTVDDSNAPLSEEAQAQAKTKAEDILVQLKNGADFDTLLTQNNEDLGEPPEGYAVSAGSGMVQEFEDASLALEVNEISELVPTTFGYHIIKRVEKKAGFEEYSEKLREEADVKINEANLKTVKVENPPVDTN